MAKISKVGQHNESGQWSYIVEGYNDKDMMLLIFDTKAEAEASRRLMEAGDPRAAINMARELSEEL